MPRYKAAPLRALGPARLYHHFAPRRRLAHSPFRLSLDGDAFCKIPWLVDVATELDREVIGKELEGNDG